MPHLEIALLGSFQVTLDGAPVTAFGTDTARALLAYLAVHPGAPPQRGVLAALLWPERPDREARRNLRQALWRVRTALGDQEAEVPTLLTTQRTIQLNPEASWSADVNAFRDALAVVRAHNHDGLEACAACAVRLAEAAPLYRGELLAGFSLDSVAFEEWLVVEREGLHWQALEVLGALGAYHEGVGGYEEAVRWARRAVELEPWREEAHRQVMRALALGGHRSAALAQYEACRRVLDDELGIEPEGATTALYERIRDGELGAPVPVAAPPAAARATVEVEAPAIEVVAPPEPLHPALERERRVATVLLADVQGSTQLFEEIGTEAWVETMNEVLRPLADVVYHYGGEVDQFRGDGLVAFFGASATHEDDPERAVLAALAMQEVAQRQAGQLVQERGIELRLRVGVNTGQVIATTIGNELQHQERTAMGEAIALASRIESTAEPGTVLVTEHTYRLVRPLFEWQALGEIRVRGVSAPLAVYRPLAHRDLAVKERGIAGLASPLVGREREVRVLVGAVEQLHAGVGGIVTVVGEAGIGKSRLVSEAHSAAYEMGSVQWVEGRCLSYAKDTAYQVWRDMLRRLLAVAPGVPADMVRDALRRQVGSMCDERAQDVYPFLAHMMALSLDADAEARVRGLGSEGLKELTFAAAETLVACAAAEAPLVLVCEDLHWADPTSLELLGRLFSLSDRVPLLLVCVFRPEREHGCWRIWEMARRSYPHRHVDVQLDPLTESESEVLLENLLLSVPGPGGRVPVENLPQALVASILERGEGNPFYVEEILRALIASGAIVCDEDTCAWQVAEETAEVTLPNTLYGVLRARIDQLPVGARNVLQLAAVIGRAFGYRVLAAVAGRSELQDHLVVLQRAQLIRERARLPELEYTFQHQLTLEAAYGGLLRGARRVLHRRVAEALERLYPERVEEQLGLLAHHWDEAGERNRALAYLYRAGEQAAARYANEEAVSYYSRALALCPEEDWLGRYGLLVAREAVYHLRGAREAQQQDLVQLREIAEALAQRDGGVEATRRLAEVALREANYYEHTFERADRAAAAQQAVRLAHAAGDAGLEAEGHLRLGSALYYSWDREGARAHWEKALAFARAARRRNLEAQVLRELGLRTREIGRFDEARAHLEQNWQIHRETGNRMEEGRALNALAMNALELHDVAGAKAYVEEGLRLCRLTGNRYDEAWALLTLGETMSYMGRYAAGDASLQEAIRLFRQVGDPVGEMRAVQSRGWFAYEAGDNDASQDLSERALRLADEINAPPIRATASISLGYALAGKACWSGASESLYTALALCEEEGWQQWAVCARAGLAHIALTREDLEGAKAHVQEILHVAEARPQLHGARDLMRVYGTCYRVLQAADDPRAEQVLQTAYDLLQGWAAKIDDEELRRSYLENVVAHREIVAAYRAVNPQHGAGDLR